MASGRAASVLKGAGYTAVAPEAGQYTVAVPLTIRTATGHDFPALTRLDLTYPTDRFLALERSGESPEHTFALRWRNRVPAPMAVYDTLAVEKLSAALEKTDLFLVETRAALAGRRGGDGN